MSPGDPDSSFLRLCRVSQTRFWHVQFTPMQCSKQGSSELGLHREGFCSVCGAPASPDITDGLQKQPAVHPQAQCGAPVTPCWCVFSWPERGCISLALVSLSPAAGDVTLPVISGVASLHLLASGPSCLPVCGAVPWPLWSPCLSHSLSVVVTGVNLKMEKKKFEAAFLKASHPDSPPHPQKPGSLSFPHCGLARWWAASEEAPLSLVSESPPGRRRQSSLWTPDMKWISWCWSCRRSSRR